MTELEIMQRAKMYMGKLTQGIDPILDQVIANGGRVISGEKDFYITQEELGRVQPAKEEIVITQLMVSMS